MLKDPKDYAAELRQWYVNPIVATAQFLDELNAAKPRLPTTWAVAVIHELTRGEDA